MVEALFCLNGLSVPKVYEVFSFSKFVEMHCFADTSSDGYSAICCFQSFDGVAYACLFIIGKSKVAPVKQLLIYRLEHCAAVATIQQSRIVNQEQDIFLRCIWC